MGGSRFSPQSRSSQGEGQKIFCTVHHAVSNFSRSFTFFVVKNYLTVNHHPHNNKIIIKSNRKQRSKSKKRTIAEIFIRQRRPTLLFNKNMSDLVRLVLELDVAQPTSFQDGVIMIANNHALFFDSSEGLDAGAFDVYLNEDITKCTAIEGYTSLEALMEWTSSQLYLDVAGSILDPTVSSITGLGVLASEEDIETLQIMFEVFENITTFYSPFYTLEDVPTPPSVVCPPPPSALTFNAKIEIVDTETFTAQVPILVDNHARFLENSTAGYGAVGYSFYITEDQSEARAIESFQDIDAVLAWLSSPLYLDVIGSILNPTVAVVTSVDVLGPQEIWDALQPILGQEMFVDIATYKIPFYSLEDTPNPPPCGNGGDGMEGTTTPPTSATSPPLSAAVSFMMTTISALTLMTPNMIM
jgi:hypothetical protein